MTGTLGVSFKDPAIYFWPNGSEPRREWKENHLYFHYQLSDKLNAYLRRRGFRVTQDPNVDKLIRRDYFVGQKGDLKFEMSRYPNGFCYNFYQDVVYKNPNGGRYDFNKFDLMPYMIRLSYLNEAKRLAKYAEKVGAHVEFVKKLSDTEEIIDTNNKNTHVHGKITCLEDIKGLMKPYDLNHNSTDANGKQIICGDEKWFYTYKGHICKGIAYHHINNMWWVMVNGKRHNIAAFNLFDKPDVIRRRKPLSQKEQMRRIEYELQTQLEKRNFLACHRLSTMLNKLNETEKEAQKTYT